MFKLKIIVGVIAFSVVTYTDFITCSAPNNSVLLNSELSKRAQNLSETEFVPQNIKLIINNTFSRLDNYFNRLLNDGINYIFNPPDKSNNGILPPMINQTEIENKVNLRFSTQSYLYEENKQKQNRSAVLKAQNNFRKTIHISSSLKDDKKHLNENYSRTELEENPWKNYSLKTLNNQRRENLKDNLFMKGYPFIVSVHHLNKYDFLLTATVISKNKVFTSASGLFDSNGNLYHNEHLIVRSISGKEEKEFSVDSIILAPDFIYQNSNYIPNDIAALKLFQNMSLNYYPTIASKSDEEPKQECTVLSWIVEDKDKGENHEKKKKYTISKTTVDLLDSETCETSILGFKTSAYYCVLDVSVQRMTIGSALFFRGKLYGVLSKTVKNGYDSVQIYTRLASTDFTAGSKRNIFIRDKDLFSRELDVTSGIKLKNSSNVLSIYLLVVAISLRNLIPSTVNIRRL